MPKKKAKKSIRKKPRNRSWLIATITLSCLLIVAGLHTSHTQVKGIATTTQQSANPITTFFSKIFPTNTSGTNQSHMATTATKQTVLSSTELSALANNTYADGNLPLGDNKYTTTTPQKGYVYLCNAQSDAKGGGAETKGSWIHGNTWNIKEKISVSGHVSWPQATFTNTVNSTTRTLSGNDLPIDHTTGIFPITSSDPAYTYDKNPNSISVQSLNKNLPLHPVYSDTPYCMGGEVGMMLTGVALFNAFDAGLRDAAAYEVQDGCNGHPQVSGEYHYHNLSSCISDISETTVIGFALDGFPITGPKVGDNKYLTTDTLDVCHGITSEIVLDGKKTTTYHYVMTQDFPYSVSCFRGKPVGLQLIQQDQVNGKNMGNTQPTITVPTGTKQPPQVAISACEGKAKGSTCSFTTTRGTISGTCQTPPMLTTSVCVPSQSMQ